METATSAPPLTPGDAAAFTAIFDRFHPLAYGIAMRILAEERAAEDVVQDVFLKLWRDPQAFHGGNFGGWLSRVTRNRALDELRKRSSRPAPGITDDIVDRTCFTDDVLARVDGERVRRSVAELPPAHRELLLLAFFGGMTHVELARRTALPLGTVKTRLRKALHRLRNKLAPDDFDQSIAS